MGAGGFILFNSMTATLALAAENATNNALEGFEGLAQEVLGYAQLTAPWEDRTGMARESLWVEVYEEDGDVYLDLGHGVDYGLYLETIQNGAYAVIMPTLEAYADRLFDAAGAGVITVEVDEGYTMETEY